MNCRFRRRGARNELLERREIRSIRAPSMVVRRVEGAKGGHRRGHRFSEGKSIRSGHGSAELASVNQGDDILRESIVVRGMEDPAG